MAVIDCVVDTTPMAKKIDHVSAHVDGTTTAVVAMQTAVVKAQHDAADDVCRNVNRGFYSLIHSQISQKIAKWKSEVDSLQLQLNQHARRLNSIKGRMERDYGMITQRYSKLFGTLNRSLKRRVYELDKAAFRFAETEIQTIQNRGKQLPATVPIAQNEAISTSQKLLASTIKYRGMRVIDTLKSFLLDLNQQKAITARILLNRGISEPDAQVYIPVVLWQGVAGRNEGELQHVAMSRQNLSQITQQSITNYMTAGENEAIKWSEAHKIDPRITEGFNALMAEFNATPRIKETMSRLYAGAMVETLKS